MVSFFCYSLNLALLPPNDKGLLEKHTVAWHIYVQVLRCAQDDTFRVVVILSGAKDLYLWYISGIETRRHAACAFLLA